MWFLPTYLCTVSCLLPYLKLNIFPSEFFLAQRIFNALQYLLLQKYCFAIPHSATMAKNKINLNGWKKPLENYVPTKKNPILCAYVLWIAWICLTIQDSVPLSPFFKTNVITPWHLPTQIVIYYKVSIIYTENLNKKAMKKKLPVLLRDLGNLFKF